ncbi:MAG: hypothetical protein RL417_1651 [Pseudomonadota bacterium]|jgi:hypothetical protein
MAKYFAPFVGKKPAALSINGHKLLIVARDRSCLEDALELVGADRVKGFSAGPSKATREVLFERLAKQINGGVVIAPANTEVSDIIRNLEIELPWLQ